MYGIIVLFLAVAIQAGYTAFCVVKKSNKPLIGFILRAAGLGVMLTAVMLHVFIWGFRWIPFITLLSVWTVIEIIKLIVKPKDKPFSTVKAILSGVLNIMAILLTLLSAIVFPQYKPPVVTGENLVSVYECTYVDKNRVETYNDTGNKREVNVKFWYPENADGTYPLIVFSHGFCGIKDSNESTFTELASNGYVVCSIDHTYHSFYTVNDKGKMTIVDKGFMKEYTELGENKQKNLELFQKWMDIRVSDINLTIDKILNSQGNVYDLINKNSIGVMGHSLGGAAAMGVPRTREDISAVVNLDAPMMCEFTGVENDIYTLIGKPYPAPILSIYSQYLYENGIIADDEEYFENRIVSATAPASYEVYIKGSQHMSLTDLVLYSPVLANVLDSGRKADVDRYYCIETMNRLVLEFFNCYLKGLGDFKTEMVY